MYTTTNKFVLDTLDLPVFVDIDSFSEKVGLSSTFIYLCSYKENISKYYKYFDIPKRDSSPRHICAPHYSLKMLQRWILENILYKLHASDYSFGFTKGVSSPLKANAEHHKDNLFILKMDLKDFFPSIDQNKVYSFFAI